MNNRIFYIVYFLIKILNKFPNTSRKIFFFKLFFIKTDFCRELLQRFKTQELIHWKEALKTFENDLKNGTKEDPATNVFTNDDDGKKRWEDFKVRVVEHVSRHFIFPFSKYFLSVKEHAYYGKILYPCSYTKNG